MAATDTSITTKRFTVTPLTAHVGAEIRGLDLARPIDEATFRALRETFFEYSVLLFRGQQLTEDEQVAFSRRFGELEIHTLKQFLHPAHPEILLISNVVENGKSIGIADAGRYWHSDVVYKPAPSLCSMLYAVEVPHDEAGQPLGDTLFVSTVRAYETLPQDMQQRLAGLKALNSLSHTFDRGRKQPDAEPGTQLTDEQKQVAEAVQPVIRTHPVTGKKAIYVNESTTVRILDIPADESARLLQFLHAHCIRPATIYRHKWQVGDLIMWDNCASQHQAIGDYLPSQRRRMHRTTVAGPVPF